ncbi:DUF7263 family protein [Halocatena marina]|uniref:Flagellin n=1 Tax=Halocatena marina TaxID=2934937 RepID=A0ABD5YGU2_9EURY|nr:hypothetical protein [Halocatena marina]
MSRKDRRGRNIDERGQGNLLALVVSLFVLTTAVGFSLILIDGAYRTADRNSGERHIAVSLAEKLVSEESNLTARANVINRTRARSLTRTQLNRTYPISHGIDIQIQLGNKTILKRGDPTGGTTVRRVVLIKHQNTVSVPFRGETLTLSPRSSRATITIDPAAAITTVRANDRVALYAPNGIEGTFDVDLSRYEETELRLEPAGAAGSVTVTHYPVQTTKTELVVTVDG